MSQFHYGISHHRIMRSYYACKLNRNISEFPAVKPVLKTHKFGEIIIGECLKKWNTEKKHVHCSVSPGEINNQEDLRGLFINKNIFHLFSIGNDAERRNAGFLAVREINWLFSEHFLEGTLRGFCWNFGRNKKKCCIATFWGQEMWNTEEKKQRWGQSRDFNKTKL